MCVYLRAQIRSDALSGGEKAAVASLAHAQASRPAAPSPAPHPSPPLTGKGAIRKHRIVENAVRKGILGLPKVKHVDDGDDGVEDSDDD